ncbi:MAG: hypothetical protein Q8J85_09620 [Sulfuricurvum sp.]|nr:hypothetical protein [Sulfuricurvum sp.]MDP3021929.1 hypothetical protein [Sulfuricurvum sp.]
MINVKGIAVSFVLSAALSVSAFGNNVKSLMTYEDSILSEMQSNTRELVNSEKILEMMQLLSNANKEFDLKTINHLHDNIYIWCKEDTQNISSILGTLAVHIEKKNNLFIALKKDLKKIDAPKHIKSQLIELENSTSEMNKYIQKMIDITYMGIDAKHMFMALSAIPNDGIKLDDYWFNPFDEEKDKTLFLLSKDSEKIENIDDLFNLEAILEGELIEYNNKKRSIGKIKLPEVGGFKFNAINNTHFKHVSFM